MLEQVELESWPVEFLQKLKIVCNFKVSILSPIQHNYILSRLSSVQKKTKLRRALI